MKFDKTIVPRPIDEWATLEKRTAEENQEVLDQALRLCEAGFSVIPLCGPSAKEECLQHGECHSAGKVSIGSWKRYQTKKASEDEIRSWFTKDPSINIGIVCGGAYELLVVDIDQPDDERLSQLNFPATVSVQTGRGFHYYYRIPVGYPLVTSKFFAGEIRAAGAYVVAPGSTHWSGNKYEWIGLEPESLEDLTDFPL